MRHERALLTVVGLASALVGVIASGQVWYRVVGHGFTGAELTDRASQALPLAGMAGVGVTLLLGRWGRRIAGLLVTALGAGLVALSASRHVPDAEQLRTTVGSEMATGHATHAHVVSVGAGVVLALVGIGFMARAGSWSTGGRRFERSAPAGTHDVRSSLDAWKAMDAGVDPTDAPDVTDAPDRISATHPINASGPHPDRS